MTKKSTRFAVQCMECGKQFSTASMDPKCPKCGGRDIDLDYTREPVFPYVSTRSGTPIGKTL